MRVQYLFSEGSGTTVANSGTAGSAGNLAFGGTPSPTFSVAGFTPAGSGYSMNNTASPAAGTGGYAQTSAAATFLDGLTQATITGWFNTETAASLARLVDRGDNTVGTGQWSLYFDGDPNKLQLNLGGTGYVSSADFGGTNTWVFFAVVIDGSSSKFYKGTPTSSSAAAGTFSASTGLGTNTKKLTVGNRESGSRAFDGHLWDIRIYDEALTDSQVETVRASAIPEPTTLAALPLLGSTILLRRCDRRPRRAED
jgi:hypothetical protein